MGHAVDSTRDAECVEFLQWALPHMRLRWRGFRRVRRQVCRRLRRRVHELGLVELSDYAAYLDANPAEWEQLDRACRVTISRFYRDHAVFDDLVRSVLPALSAQARRRGDAELTCWSAGCASGEEPYSLAMLWHGSHPLRIIATDADPYLITRAEHGCYHRGSLKEVPEQILEDCFERQGDDYCVRPHLRQLIEFRVQDLRHQLPAGPFDLICCRNLALSYFDEELQRDVLEKISARLRGALVIGAHETLPPGTNFEPWPGTQCIYRTVGHE